MVLAVSTVLGDNCYGIRLISPQLHCFPQVSLLFLRILSFLLDFFSSCWVWKLCDFDGTVVGSLCLREKGDSNGEWRQWPLRVSVDRLTDWVNLLFLMNFVLVLNSLLECLVDLKFWALFVLADGFRCLYPFGNI